MPSCSISRSTSPTRRSSAGLRNRSRFSSGYFLMCLRGFDPSGRRPHISARLNILEMISRRPVGVVGDVPEVVMDLGDVSPGYLGHAMAPERRNDHPLQHPPVALGRARFQPKRDVLFIEAVGELLDRDGPPVGIAPGGRILTILGRGDNCDRPVCAPARR